MRHRQYRHLVITNNLSLKPTKSCAASAQTPFDNKLHVSLNPTKWYHLYKNKSSWYHDLKKRENRKTCSFSSILLVRCTIILVSIRIHQKDLWWDNILYSLQMFHQKSTFKILKTEHFEKCFYDNQGLHIQQKLLRMRLGVYKKISVCMKYAGCHPWHSSSPYLLWLLSCFRRLLSMRPGEPYFLLHVYL